MEAVLEEANRLAERGVTELIVIAQDTTQYGKDLYGESRLPQLLNRGSKIFQGAVRHDDRNARLQPQLADGAHAVDMDWRMVPVFCRGVPESGNDLLKPVG